MAVSRLASRLTAELPGLPARRLLLIPPSHRPTMARAWAPDTVMLQLLLSGSIPLDVPQDSGARRITAGPGDLLLICPGGWARRHFDTPRHHLTVYCWSRPVLREISSPGDGRLHPPSAEAVVDPSPALANTLLAMNSCATTPPQPNILAPLAHAFLGLLAADLQTNGGGLARRWTAIRAWISEHCDESLSREQTARHFGIGGDHLSRLLRQANQGSFIELVHRCRIERAATLLRQSQANLDEVALRCGLRSASYLIRLFRRHYGTTPQRWRHAHAAGSGEAAAT